MSLWAFWTMLVSGIMACGCLGLCNVSSQCTEMVFIVAAVDHCSYDDFFVCAVLALFWFGIAVLAFYYQALWPHDVITIAVLAIWCWQLHVSRCHDISPPPAVLAKGVIQAMWPLLLCWLCGG